MKEATGELNMTVITIVAIAAIAAFFYFFVWPGLQRSIARNQCAAEWGVDRNDDAVAITVEENANGTFTCTCTAGPCVGRAPLNTAD